MGEQDDKPPLRSDNCAAFAFFMSCMFWNCLTLNFTHMRMPDPQLYPPLRDAGFDLIPIIRLQWITDAMIGYYNVVIILLWLFVSIIDKDVAKCRHMFNKYFVCPHF
ncbi:hypothetical protein DIPPA_15074 [Diplonema papillatum]|nr:hypothetical protein DIPPA_15074 [Diplonema papillatum]